MGTGVRIPVFPPAFLRIQTCFLNTDTIMQILCLDIAGQPFRWLTIEQAAYYVAANKISWTFGDADTVLHGGMRRVDAQRSTLSIPQ